MNEPTNEEINSIQLRDDSVQEILSTPPAWLVRWGTTIVFLGVAILLLIAWFLRYPDIVTAPVTLTTPQPPVRVVSPTAGNLTTLFVDDNEEVEAGQRLGIIKSLANPEHIFELENLLKNLHALHPDTLQYLKMPVERDYGELQASYSEFVQYLENYQLFLSQRTELKKIPFLKDEIVYLKSLNRALYVKDSIFREEIKLASQNYDRQQKALKIGGVIPEKVEGIKAQILQYDRQRQDVRLQILNNQIRINDLNNQISDIRQRTEEASQGQYILAKESLSRLKSSLRQWLKDYVLVAPIDGRIAFYQVWSQQQYIAANTEVFTIVPEIDQIMGKIMLPVLGSGKVEVGQDVNIKLAAFPYREYGMVKGKVEKIALVSKESTLLVDISLPKGLKTTYQKDLPFRQQMQGSAEIITKERRLLERFIEQFLTGQ